MIFHVHAQYTTQEGLVKGTHKKHTFVTIYMCAYISDPRDCLEGGGTQARGGKSQCSPLLYATLKWMITMLYARQSSLCVVPSLVTEPVPTAVTRFQTFFKHLCQQHIEYETENLHKLLENSDEEIFNLATQIQDISVPSISGY